MTLTKKELKIFSMYLKNDIFYFYDNKLTGLKTWDCRASLLNECKQCHFHEVVEGRSRCVVNGNNALRTQIMKEFPKEFE